MNQRKAPASSSRPDAGPAPLPSFWDRAASFGDRGVLLAILLFVLVAWVFLPSIRNGFIDVDDPGYIFANAQVRDGFTWAGIGWAFTTSVGGSWHPLTWLSIMLDCQLFGVGPAGHHLADLLLHAASAVLLFLGFQRLTGATWRSLLVALLFGIHPLRVESVAWAAERKDSLSTLFWMLTLLTYARYVNLSKAQNPKARTFYCLTLVVFCLGLMSKPMIVTLPCIMLLLDWWPLHRPVTPALWKEKLPFFVLGLLVSALTVYTQRDCGELAGLSDLTLRDRMINATLSYGRYLAQMIWPLNLSFYPLPQVFPIWPAVGVGLGLLAASLFALWTVRTRPYVAFGWSWYLVTLLPVIGLLQVGRMSHADRYTYIPSIGVVALLVWGAHDLTRRCRYQFLILSALAVAATLPCIALTRRQLSYWKDSESQVRHALEVTTNNDAAHSGLGLLLVRKGLLDEAIREFEITIRLNPGFAEAHYDLGIVLALKGQLDEAVHQFQEALRLKPQYVEAHNNLGIALFRKGQMEGAIREFEEAIRLNPAFAEGHCNLGLAVGKTGRADEAIGHFEAALQANRDYPEAHNYLGMVLCQRGRTSEGLRHFQEALRLKPGYAEARKNLDAVLAAQSNTPPPTSPESRQ